MVPLRNCYIQFVSALFDTINCDAFQSSIGYFYDNQLMAQSEDILFLTSLRKIPPPKKREKKPIVLMLVVTLPIKLMKEFPIIIFITKTATMLVGSPLPLPLGGVM